MAFVVFVDAGSAKEIEGRVFIIYLAKRNKTENEKRRRRRYGRERGNKCLLFLF